jgi:predicted membrane protein
VNEARLRTILLVLAIYHLVLGAFMFFAPGAFYDTVGKFPPENHHYIKDVSTFYIALGVAFYVSVRYRSWRTPVLAFSALEYGLHAINHLVDVNEATSDLTGWFDFFALAALAIFFAALASFAWRVHPEEPQEPEPTDEGLHSGS